MIPKECKRLAEVDFPISIVSKHSSAEKEARCGHIPKLHIWPAARPTGSCRAMLLGLLLPDPCDPCCPAEFKAQARKVLSSLVGKVGPRDKHLQKALLKFIANFASWDLAGDRSYLDVGRGLVRAAHTDETPLVIDSFAGGGSIPLEALRLGCDTFASDVNPVACLILKAILEDIPRHGPKLAEELRRIAVKIKNQAEQELTEFYPKVSGDETPISYLWTRTVRCESPNCGAEIPLVRSFKLCKKENRNWSIRYEVSRQKEERPEVTFEVFQPTKGHRDLGGTVARAKARCLCCGAVLAPERVRAQLSEQRGGADVVFDEHGNRIGGARILAVVVLKSGEHGRHYRLPTRQDYQAVWKAQTRLKEILDAWDSEAKKDLSPVPDEPTPAGGGSGAGRAFSIQRYGMMNFGDLFTARQKVALATITKLLKILADDNPASGLLALCLSKMVDMNNNLATWQPHAEIPAHMLTRFAIPMKWDFAEAVPISDSSGTLETAVKRSTEPFKNLLAIDAPGTVEQADARSCPLPDQSAQVWFTDPPYYDAVPYADISDFFFVWLKRTLPDNPVLRDTFDPKNPLTPKLQEIVQDEIQAVDGRPKDRGFFEESMAKAFCEGRRILRGDGLGSIVFAHKTTEGWEALLSGLIRGGWTVTGSWPIVTEMGSRLRARESAALATSVHLVCRPRPEDASVGDWAEVLRELPKRVGDWMERLQSEGIRGADLVFACIGPALEIFSRFSKVETADGKEVNLAEYLEKVWEVVGRTALEQVLGTEEARARNGVAGALEEDARLTALFLWTLQSTNGGATPSIGTDEVGEEKTDDDEEETMSKGKAKGFGLMFDVVRRFAQPLGLNLPKWEDRIITTEKGVVRLIPVFDRMKQLFGEKGMKPVVEEIEFSKVDTRQLLLPGLEEFVVSKAPKKSRGRKVKFAPEDPSEVDVSATTLDRVHAAMLLQAGGQSSALRTFIKAEVERGPYFLRLANALSALYPKGSEEKRLLDAMLLAVPR